MNFYTKQHKYYCGIDLHAKTMYVCVMDVEGKVLLHRNIRNDAEYFLKILEPYREDVVVAVECVFSWYWVADLCADEDIEFVLGHALYMRAIHGGKAKNDKVDSLKIAALTRGGMLPTAFVYPKRMRSARDLMRRRTHLCRMRAELVAHTQLCRLQYNLPAFEREIRHRHGGVREGIVEHFEDLFVKKSVATNVELIDYIDSVLKRLELDILKAARGHDPDALRILQTIPGVGKILSLTILYEICDIKRFPRVQDYLSYCRLVKCRKESAGKDYGSSGKKIGNAHLKWAYSESCVMFLRESKQAKSFVEKRKKGKEKGKALSILSARLGRASYFMLSKNRSFDMDRFF